MSPAAADRPNPRDGGHDAGDPRLARHVADLRARLRPACRGWDDGAFEALVLRIARTKVRWAEGEDRA